MKHTTNNLTAALELASSSIRIFPALLTWNAAAHKFDKRPALSGWQAAAAADPEQIRTWWKQLPAAVPGIELGRGGLIVIDPDRHPGQPDGIAAFATLRGDHDLPPHPVVVTASGGQHHYFRQPIPPLGNGRGNLPAGIDVRGAGGWTVAPGAVHAGARGSWRDTGPVPLADAYRAGAIPMLPTWLLEVIRPPRRHERRRVFRGSTTGIAGMGGLIRTIVGACEGQRNATLFWGACRLGEAVRSGKLDSEPATAILLEAAARAGLPQSEALRTIKSALRTTGAAP
jgi:hypothetical protein